MRVLTILLTALVICVVLPSVSAAGMTVGAGSATAAPGSTFDIPVTVTNARDLGSMDLSISYDPGVISIVSVEKGSLNKGLLSANTDTPGTVTIVIVDSQGMNGDGPVAVIKCKAAGTDGTTTMTVSSVLAYNVKSHVDIRTERSAGIVTVKNGGVGAPLPVWTGAGAIAVAVVFFVYRRR